MTPPNGQMTLIDRKQVSRDDIQGTLCLIGLFVLAKWLNKLDTIDELSIWE
jgi:hypothetical protein